MLKLLRHSLVLLLIMCFTQRAKTQCMYPVPSPSYNCGSATGELTISIIGTGIAPPYTLTSVALGINTVVTNTYVTFANLPAAGFYTVNIYSAGTCTYGYVQGSFPNPTASINISLSTNNVDCYGGTNGGASATYLYPTDTHQWSTGATSSSIGGLSAGVYSVVMTTTSGCSAGRSFTINQPPQIDSQLSSTLIPCYGGTINSVVTTTGGVAPYSYTVNGNPVSSSSGSIATGIVAGTQTIITKDSKGCLQSNVFTLSQAAQQIITPTITQPNCPGDANGAISVIVNGPVAGYTYSWTPGSASGSIFQNLAAGNYTLDVLDLSNCITRSVITVPPAPAIVPAATITKENCSAADGSYTLNATGGMAPYTYTTLPGNLPGNTASGLTTGTYTTIIEDAKGCIDSSLIYVGNLSTVSLHILTVTPVQCYNMCNGSVLLNTQNAVQPVSYSITGLPVTTNSVLSNLCAGFYMVKALDANGCPAFDTLNFPQPAAFSYSAASPAAICIGRYAQLKASAGGGTGVLSYLWNPGSLSGQTVNVEPVVTTTYSLNVYDSKGCTLDPYAVTVNVNPKLTIDISNSNAGICPGTTAQITPTVTGGDGNYSFLWLPGESKGASIFVENIKIPTYTVVVNDACGTPTAYKEITIKIHPVIQPLFKQEGKGGCTPYCTSFINITPDSKNAIWNYGDKPFEQRGDTTFYCYEKAGDFNLRLSVTDANSCKASYTYTNAVHVLVKPQAGFVTEPGTITLNDAENVQIKNITSNASSYKWYVDGVYFGTTENISYSFRDTGCYDIRLLTENANGCKDSTIRSICVFEGFNFYMPNAFTPNNDGINDVFLPKGTGWLYENYSLNIYNRWGHKIFSTTDVYKGWDGGIEPDAAVPDAVRTDPNDIYSWRVVVTDNLQKEHVLRGFVNVLR
ncbi:hypothetical protein CNR22_24030 [Sphingobacteriaceae bacterium]|nr:hypothetical protein CNR22_24030 [Sphingobacteriaceae bacterium]